MAALLSPNTVLHGRYQIIRMIGKGGMGAVYEAVDQRLQATVALKQTLLQGSHADDAFAREAQLLARLHHQGLPKVMDYFTESQGQFLVMEFFEGDDLSTLLVRRGSPFPVEIVLDWADQILQALDYLHRQKPPVVHRDIKPQNLKCTDDGHIVLLDFGLAKGLRVQDVTVPSLFGFTPQYAPPEQVEGSGTGPQSDLYALAATLHHLLTNQPPPRAQSRMTARYNQQTDPLRPVHELNPNVPVTVSMVLQQALAMNSSERPDGATALREAFQKARTLSSSKSTVVLDTFADDDLSTIASPPGAGEQNVQLPNEAGQGGTVTQSTQHLRIKQAEVPYSQVEATSHSRSLRNSTPYVLPALSFLALCMLIWQGVIIVENSYTSWSWLLALGSWLVFTCTLTAWAYQTLRKRSYKRAKSSVAAGGVVLFALLLVPGFFSLVQAQVAKECPLWSVRSALLQPFCPAPDNDAPVTVVVADFDETSQGRAYIDAVYTDVRTQVTEFLGDSSTQVDFLRVGYILHQVKEEEEEEEETARLAELLNANVVVWGKFQEDRIIPRFQIVDYEEGIDVANGFEKAPAAIANDVVLDSRTKIVTLFVQGLVYLFNQDYAQARDEFAQTYKLIPYYEGERIKSVVLFFKGWSLWKSGDTAAAQEAFTETLQLNEEYSWAYIGLGNLDFDAAMEAKGSGEECAPYDTSLLDDALTDYQRAIETHRTQVEGPSKAALVEAKAYANIGNVYYELAEQHYCTYQDEALVQNLQRSEDALAEALRLYAAALQDNVAVAHQYAVYVHYALGRTYLLADDLDNAEQQFNHCINQTTESVRNKETAQLCEKGLNRIAELRDTQ